MNTELPRLSVITPVFNGEKYIVETIESVIDCIGDLDIEYIVIDDGSTDSTAEILKSYAGRIEVVTQINQGESTAVNTGFHHALGDFLLVVSADDPLLTSEIFEGVIEFFENNPKVVVWYPNWQMIDQNGNFVREVLVEEYSDEKLIGRFMCLPGPGAFIRKSAALQIGGRRDKWRFVGDYDFWLRISRVGYLEKRDALLAQWRFHDDSTSIAQRGSKMAQERTSVIDEFIEEFKISRRLTRMARAHAYYFASLLSYHSNDVKGKKLLLKAYFFRRGLVEEAQIRVLLYIILLPLSRLLKPSMRKFLSKYIQARK